MSDQKAILENQLNHWRRKHYDAQFIDDFRRMQEERDEALKKITGIEAVLKELEGDGSR